MKNLNLNILVLAASLLAVSVPGMAEEAGFSVEDSIRQQIFMELKSNVRSLYRGDELLVPAIDTSNVSRVAHSRNGENPVIPTAEVDNSGRDRTVTDNIN